MEQLKVIHDEVPANVAKIVDARMRDFIVYIANDARSFGTLNLNDLARSAYLQGFCDAYNVLTHKPYSITHK